MTLEASNEVRVSKSVSLLVPRNFTLSRLERRSYKERTIKKPGAKAGLFLLRY